MSDWRPIETAPKPRAKRRAKASAEQMGLRWVRVTGLRYLTPPGGIPLSGVWELFKEEDRGESHP